MINQPNKIFQWSALVLVLMLAFNLFYFDVALATHEGGISHELISNPIGPINDIQTLIEKILGIVVKIGLPVVALSIIYVGFLFVLARGSEEKLKEAKGAFVYTMIGAAIVLGAFVISSAIKATVDEIKGE